MRCYALRFLILFYSNYLKHLGTVIIRFMRMCVFTHGIFSFLICTLTLERRLLINIDRFGDRETILTRHTSHPPDVKGSPAVSKRAKTRKSILLAGNMNHLVGNDERDHDSEGSI